jgi:surface antigen
MSDSFDSRHDIPDELLMAYADGELAAGERARVERAIAANPNLRATVAVFTATRDPVQRAFTPLLASEVPDRLLQAIAAAPMPAARSVTGARVGLLDRLKGGWFAGLSPAAALGLALVVGSALGAVVTRSMLAVGSTTGALLAAVDGGIEARGVLAEALHTVPGGSRLAAAGATVTPVLTFQSQSGAFCRQYEAKSAAENGYVGYACRTADGSWRVEMHVPSTVASGERGGIRPASGAANSALEAAISSVIDGDPLMADVEVSLIKRRWKS